MKVERNFNKRSAPLVDVQTHSVWHGQGNALGVCATLFERGADGGALRMHMTPDEAVAFGMALVKAGINRLKSIGKLD